MTYNLYIFSEIYSPKISSFKSTTVNNDNKAVITCSVDSHPMAEVTWFKEGLPLAVEKINTVNECVNREEGQYFELVNTGDNPKPKQHKLVICKSVWKKNNGTYSCLATNNLGKTEKQSTIVVNGNSFLN